MVPTRGDLVLLLTATIDPGATIMVTRTDPRLRLRDYQQSLTQWLSSGAVKKVVVYENSGFDVSSLRAIARSFPACEVEFHSFTVNDSGATRGKGHSELLGIARTLSHSELLQRCNVMVKCTGRLNVRNAAALFRLVQESEFDVMCSMRRNFTFADSRLFAATPAFVSRYLIPRQAIVDDTKGLYFEHALARAVAAGLIDGGRWLPFPVFPDIRGISGTSGLPQTLSLGRLAVESVLHRLGTFLSGRWGI